MVKKRENKYYELVLNYEEQFLLKILFRDYFDISDKVWREFKVYEGKSPDTYFTLSSELADEIVQKVEAAIKHKCEYGYPVDSSIAIQCLKESGFNPIEREEGIDIYGDSYIDHLVSLPLGGKWYIWGDGRRVNSLTYDCDVATVNFASGQRVSVILKSQRRVRP